MIASVHALSAFGRVQNPKFTSIPVENGVYNERYDYHITTTGPANTAVEIVLSSGTPPPGVVLEDNGDRTGLLSGVPGQTGKFPIELMVREVSNHANSDTQAFTLEIAKAMATVSLDNLTVIYNGSPQPVKTKTEPEGLALEVTYDGSVSPPAQAGEYAVVATVKDINYEGSANGRLSILKEKATVTLSDLIKIYNGNPQAPTATTEPEGLKVDFTYDGSSETPVNADSYEVEATIDDQNYEGSTKGTFVINKAGATVTLSEMSKEYTGSPQSPAVATNPPGLAFEITYDESPDPPSEPGNYDVVVNVTDPNYAGSATGIFTISDSDPIEATVTLSDLATTYTGDEQYPTATTDPPGLSVEFTFDGDSDAPVNAGTYAVVATVTEPGYTGSANGTFVINKAEATVNLTDLSKEYTGSPQEPTVSTSPSGLTYQITYNGSPEVPSEPGSYTVVATVTDPNYTASATATFTISREVTEATVTLSDLTTTYTGSQQVPTATTDPPGLSVEFTFNGALEAPVNAGSYAVVATITEPGYSGSATGNFVINKAGATVTLTEMSKEYTGDPQQPTVSTSPPDLAYRITYNGSPDPPTDVGSYDVFVSITDPNYQGSAMGAFEIIASEASITITNLEQVYDGAPKIVTVTTVPPDLAVDVTYDGASIPPVNAGSYQVVATIDDEAYSGSKTATLVISKAPVDIMVAQESLRQNYDGSPKPVSVVTDPMGVAVNILYEGLSTPPVEQGSYLVQVDVADPNYSGSASETLIINGPPVSTGINDVAVNEDAANYRIDLKQYFEDIEDDDDELSFTIQNNTNSSLFSGIEINQSQVLVLAFALNQNGTADITVRGTDTEGLYFDDQFKVSINSVPDDPYFVSDPVTGALQGQNYSYNVEATDPDAGEILTLSHIFMPDWLTFTDNGGGMGRLSGVPEINDIGSHEVTLEVTDEHGNTATQAFTIKVAESNREPFFTSSPIKEARQGQLYRYYITAEDANENKLVITASTAPAWLAITDNGNGTAVLEGTPDNEETGEHQVVLTVTDIFGAADMQSFIIDVRNINDPPAFVSTPATVAGQHTMYSYEIITDDIDPGDSRDISGNIPSWLELTDNGNGTGLLSGNAPPGTSGQHYFVSLTVRDDDGAVARQNFTIIINTPPEVSDITLLIKEDSVWQFDTHDFSLGFTDQNGDTVTKVKIETLPTAGGLMLFDAPVNAGTEISVTNGEIGALAYVPDDNESGTASFTWFASDGYDWAERSANVHIEIESVNDKPVLTNIESMPLIYSQKEPGVPVTQSIIINDVDNSYMQGAEIAIHKGYVRGEDILTYDGQSNANIIAEFDEEKGVMMLTGEDTRSNYEIALSGVLFSSNVIGEIDNIEKTIGITISDGMASSDSAFREVSISGFLPELDIVNAFTPNNDNINDQWDFINLEFYSAIRISVFTPGGTQVFSCSQADCFWDGTSNGKQLPAGEYFYTIDLNNGKRTYQGVVTILK